MTHDPLPSGGGAFVREKDGTLRRIEEPTVTDPAEIARRTAPTERSESPVEEAVKAPAKPTRKEA